MVFGRWVSCVLGYSHFIIKMQRKLALFKKTASPQDIMKGVVRSHRMVRRADISAHRLHPHSKLAPLYQRLHPVLPAQDEGRHDTEGRLDDASLLLRVCFGLCIRGVHVQRACAGEMA